MLRALRREDCRSRVHQLPQPARAAAGDARLAGRAARRPAVRDRRAIRTRPWRGRRELAGPDGAVLATGSIYLVADLLAEPGRRRASAL